MTQRLTLRRIWSLEEGVVRVDMLVVNNLYREDMIVEGWKVGTGLRLK